MKKKRFYQGFYRPQNPDKYKGDVKQIVYRSSWELAFFRYCDLNPGVLEWASEEIVIPYISPLDNKTHRYFVDVWLKQRTKNGNVVERLIEIKPDKERKIPSKRGKKQQNYVNEVMTYAVNQAKWSAAEAYANQHGMIFSVLTEKELAPLLLSKKKRG